MTNSFVLEKKMKQFIILIILQSLVLTSYATNCSSNPTLQRIIEEFVTELLSPSIEAIQLKNLENKTGKISTDITLFSYS